MSTRGESGARRLLGAIVVLALSAGALGLVGCTTTVTSSDAPAEVAKSSRDDKVAKSGTDAASDTAAEGDAEPEDAKAGEGASEPVGGTGPAYAGVRENVASWGLTISVPEGWTSESSGSKELATFKATGPGGAYVRVDETLNSSGAYDPLPGAKDLDSRLGKKYDDYRRISLMRSTFHEMPAVLWEFTHTSDDGINLHKIDWFFQRAQSDPPTAIVVA